MVMSSDTETGSYNPGNNLNTGKYDQYKARGQNCKKDWPWWHERVWRYSAYRRIVDKINGGVTSLLVNSRDILQLPVTMPIPCLFGWPELFVDCRRV